MKAVMLCAGKGTRLKELTYEVPKPLVNVAGTPILIHNLKQLIGIVDEAILVVGFKKEMMFDLLGEDYEGIKITYIEQSEQLGTGHAVSLVRDSVNEDFLLLGADDLFSKEEENLGKVSAVIKIKNNNLIQIYINETEVLLPFSEKTILVLDHSKKQIKLDIPDGLIELYTGE